MTAACLPDALLLDFAERRRPLDVDAENHLADCADCRFVLGTALRNAARIRDDTHGVAQSTHPLDDEPSWDELGIDVVVAQRYVLERFLGAGSMGVVWGGRRNDDGSRVALKIARSADPELRRRFEREARVTTSLDHPNIVRTLDVVAGTDARGPCLVMPLLVGETLDARLKRETVLPLREAARIAMQIVSALAAAHARGVVHRDVKPSNVFLTDERVVVLDFGLAKLLPAWGEASGGLTRTGVRLGTPAYMAPEQLFGEKNIDARVDVWALGALLFCMISGQPPIRSGTLGQMLKELRGGCVPDLADLVPGLPNEITQLVRDALTIPKDRRASDVRSFAAVLLSHVA